MATHHDRYTEVRYEYTDTLQGASPMLTLGRLRVRSNPKGYEIQTDTRLTNHASSVVLCKLKSSPL